MASNLLCVQFSYRLMPIKYVKRPAVIFAVLPKIVDKWQTPWPYFTDKSTLCIYFPKYIRIWELYSMKICILSVNFLQTVSNLVEEKLIKTVFTKKKKKKNHWMSENDIFRSNSWFPRWRHQALAMAAVLLLIKIIFLHMLEY